VTRIDDPLLSGISGKLGKEVYRRRKNGIFSYRRPDSINVSQSESALNTRRNFGAASKLSSALNKDLILKQIWKSVKIEAKSSFHRMMSYNSKFTNNQKLTLENVITPPRVPLHIDSISFRDSVLSLSLFPQEDSINGILKPPFRLYACIYAFNPFKQKLDSFVIIFIPKDLIEISKENKYAIQLTKDTQSLISAYRSYFVYIALARSTGSKTTPLWTSTYADAIK
jgi:hypothetical protein